MNVSQDHVARVVAVVDRDPATFVLVGVGEEGGAPLRLEYGFEFQRNFVQIVRFFYMMTYISNHLHEH